MEEIRAGHGVLNVQANHRDGKKDQDSGRNRARTRWLCIREKEQWKICEGLKGFEVVMRLGLRLDCLRKPSSSSLHPYLSRFLFQHLA